MFHKEEFLHQHLISHVIDYPSIDSWNSLEPCDSPCIVDKFICKSVVRQKLYVQTK